MRVLAIDTAGLFGSIAILENDTVIEEFELHSVEGFSTVLFDAIRQLLDRHGWTLDSIDCFAGAAGPGSFTGVRTGLTAVKSLAETLGRAAIGVSNLQARAAGESGTTRAVAADARRGEIYGAVYNAELQLVSPEVVMPLEAWLASLPPGTAVPATEERSLAGAIAQIARQRLLAGDSGDPAILHANYIRRPDAETNWKEGRVA